MPVKTWGSHSGNVVDQKDIFEIIDCVECGFKHATPIPTAEEMESIYRHDYYKIEKPLYISRYTEDLEWWRQAYVERYEWFEKILGARRRKLLDVGSGPGFFLQTGNERGWQTLGVEPSTQAAEHTRNLGLEVIENFLTASLVKELGKFDVVHLSDVLEHIPDPAAMVRMANQLLNPGGLICIVVPNDFSPFQQALQKACDFPSWWIIPPHHINFFDFQSLSGLLGRNGFRSIHQTCTFPIDLFLLIGDNYVGNDSVGRQCHERRKKFEHNLRTAGMNDLKQKLYESLAALNIGREIVMVAEKFE